MSDSNVISPKSSSSEDEYYKQWTKYRILEKHIIVISGLIARIVQTNSLQITLQ